MSTKDRLSVEAARLFAERGYHGTSIGDLAEALGIRKASVYSHISGKEDLLNEIALAGATAFHLALDQIPDGGDPLERLRLALGAHLDVVFGQLDVATVWLHEWRHLTGTSRERFRSERRRYERRIYDLFADAVTSGALRSDLDVQRGAVAFLSIGNWAFTWMSKRSDVEQEANGFWAILLEGLQSR
jgi:AcrR family transcriptional regulator